MASKTGAIWAIDIGSNSLKALQLTTEGGAVEVIGFEDIQHSKILSGAGVKSAERDELVALSLRKFAGKYDLSKDEIIISVPSQNSFARFVNLPPVEKKRIPEIVKFEAVQQIPFDINDVQWDWQLMTDAESPETKVGIFAIKNEVVDSALEHFSRENLKVSYVQMSPMALYNYVLYDRPDLIKSDNQPVVVLNIGADNTDLVVCTKSTVWQRCILIGGNAFTKAIADAFKLNFEKAEKLKRTAPVSKYARQIFQAMRPVFTDLVSEVQRSLGFYTSSNPNAKISRIIGLGGGTKLRGLLKFLQQTLQVPVERPDSFKRLAISSSVSLAKFHESVCDFGVVYGLALQGIGLARIKSNLLPRSVVRSMAWAGKSRYFTAAAAILLAVSILCFARVSWDKISYSGNSSVRQEISSILSEAERASQNLEAIKNEEAVYEAAIKKEFEPFKYRDVMPLLYETIFSALPNEKNNPEQKELYEAFKKGDVERVLQFPPDIEEGKRKERKQIFITGMSVYFTNDVNTATFSQIDLSTSSRSTIEGIATQYGYRSSPEMMERGVMGGRARRQPAVEGGVSGTTGQQKAGFVVTIVGYSPYKDLGALMDPYGVENNRSKWGFITRLMHPNDIVEDGDSPFEPYNKGEAQHFRLDIQPISTEAAMPAGIGIPEVRYKKAKGTQTSELILIDPMTKEIISRVPALEPDGTPKLDHTGTEIYELNDHWFVLNAKFIWKNAPHITQAPTQPVSPEIPQVPATQEQTKTRDTGGDKRRKLKEYEDY